MLLLELHHADCLGSSSPAQARGHPCLGASSGGVAPPWPPNLIWLDLLVNSLVFLLISPVNLLIFWDWIACELISVFLCSSMQVITTCTCFFSRFLLSRKYKIQIVARVGRKSAVVLSGIMGASYPQFFIGRGFDCQRALLENVKLGKLVLIGLQSPREWKNRTRLDEYYFFYYLIPPGDVIRKKNVYSYKK